MRRVCAAGCAAAAVASLAGGAAGQTYSFVGNGFADWHVASNWSPSGVPGINPAGVEVSIGSTPATLGPGLRPSISKLDAASTLVVNNGITISGDCTITNVDMRGTDPIGVVCGGRFTLTGPSAIWRGGIIDCVDGRQTGILTIGGPGGTGVVSTLRGTLRNEGAVAMATRLRFENFGRVENAASWDIGANLEAETATSPAGGEFVNTGTVTRIDGRQATVTTSFESTGQIRVSQGWLGLSGYHTKLRGTIQLQENGTLRTTQAQVVGMPTVKLGFDASGQGDLIIGPGNHLVDGGCNAAMSIDSPNGLWIDQFSNGEVVLEAPIFNAGKARFTSGRLAGFSPFVNTLEGTMYWGLPSSTGAHLATSLTNNGILVLRGAPRVINGTVNNIAPGVMDVSAGGLSRMEPDSSRVYNTGTIAKNILSQVNSALDVLVEMADGSGLAARSAVLTLSGGSLWDGNTSLEVGPGPTAGVTFGGIGHVVRSGRLTVSGSAGVVDVRPDGILSVDGSLDNLVGGANGSEFLIRGILLCGDDPFAFRNLGVVRLLGGTLDGGPTGGFWNESLVLFDSGTILQTVVNKGTMTVRGTGHVGVSIGSAGRIFNVSGGIIQLQGSSSLRGGRPDSLIKNEDLLYHDGTGVGTITGLTLDNQGRIEARTGMLTIGPTITVQQIQDGALMGGTWTALPGAVLNMPPGITKIGAGGKVSGSSASCPWLTGVGEISGEFQATGDTSFPGAVKLEAGGRMTIEPGVNVTAPGGVEHGDEESFLDEIEEKIVISDGPEPRLTTPTLDCFARLVPGGHARPGPFNLTGNLVMRPSARVLVELGGETPLQEHDRVAVMGSAALAGTLDLSLMDGFIPEIGQEFTVLTATGGVTGAFGAVVQPPGMPPGREIEIVQTAGAVVARVVAAACYPNCDGSTTAPVLNVSDFICFQTRYAAGDPYANCDGSTVAPVLNVSDFVCFLSSYAGGCR